MHPLLIPPTIFAVALITASCQTPTPTKTQLQFDLTIQTDSSTGKLDGRAFLILAKSNTSEPRFQINARATGQQIFGIDVEDLEPDRVMSINATVLGFPKTSLSEVPPGSYWVQAVFHRYETFRRADGHTVKLPMDRGEGQHWNRAPGNFYSKPTLVRVDPAAGMTISITLDQVIPPIPQPKDTKYIKHVRIRSELLSKFWGRPMHLGACVLLPHGFDEHPEARFPLVVNHGHFPLTFGGFREAPPDPDLKPDYSDRFHMAGYNRVQQEYAHAFYQQWVSSDMPRLVIIKVQHANPYYDDSYAVNSANLGPYGDAINHELIPFLEKKFRCLGEGWSRFTYGGSTGGWEALATQVLYPDMFNGCFAACPDPIDFRAFTVVDIYKDKNAYFVEGDWKRTPRPGHRNYLGHIDATLRDMNLLELVLGTKSRSGDQWDIWEAVYGPVGADGYPERIWDKTTGEIDTSIAAYWRENYDLTHIMKRDWKTLGPKLQGKIHIYCGAMDNYYLNNAVYLAEAFLKSTEDPYFDGVIDYGPRAEHCWNGDQERPNAISRLRYHQMYLDRILSRIKATAPKGADLTSWRY